MTVARLSAGQSASGRRRRRFSIRQNLSGVVGGGLTLIFLIAAVAAPLVAPADPFEQNLVRRLMPPAWAPRGSLANLLGTDQLGRDLLSRIIFGAQVSFFIGIAAVLVGAVIGLPLGILGGYYGGVLDVVVQRMIEIQMGLPFILLAIILTVLFRPGMLSLIIILGISSWIQYGRLSRIETASVKEQEYISAARAIGCSDARIMTRHIFPNLVPTVIVVLSIQLPRTILAEATLSFLGLGVMPPTPSWGGMINEGREFVFRAWWLQTFPGIAMVLCVTAIGLLGNWLRDRLDPRLRF